MGTFVYVFAAYSITWVVLFGYFISLWRKQDRIEKGLERLKQQGKK